MAITRWFEGRGVVTRIACLAGAIAAPAQAQVDQQRAAIYFKEAAVLCEREGGRLWGVSLCGPMVIADAATRSIATNQPPPDAPRPPAFGFANAAMPWGGATWSTYAWSMIPADDERARGRLLMHELYHRVQKQLGLFVNDGQYDHLDTAVGRYWLQLEWRALARALGASGAEQVDAVRDALAFRARRRAAFRDAAENEQRLELNEGLAQYTGTVAVATNQVEAIADAIAQLNEAPRNPTFVRTFAYPSGAAYGVLLDAWAPGWTRQIKATDDLGQLLTAAARTEPATNPEAAAERYGGAELRIAEERRDHEQKARVADLRRRFVDGPVVVVPRGRNASFTSTGMTPIPGAGTIYPNYRVSGDWGSLVAASVLVNQDNTTLTLPGPARVEGATASGDGWVINLANDWVVRPAAREGDAAIVRATAAEARAAQPGFTPESDPDVQNARRGLPIGGTPPKKTVDRRPRNPGRYPPGTQLLVMLDGVVTAGGLVKIVAVERSNDRAFADECVRAALEWRYEPAKTADGQPFAMRTKFTCTLSIK